MGKEKIGEVVILLMHGFPSHGCLVDVVSARSPRLPGPVGLVLKRCL